jgi:NAD(P)-dependent dehydrogenase (short-subunit alcohol dehydrogenase family)
MRLRCCKLLKSDGPFPSPSPTACGAQLSSFDSVRKFVRDLKAFKSGRPLDSLVCNAAVYMPARDFPTFTKDGFEEQLQVMRMMMIIMR